MTVWEVVGAIFVAALIAASYAGYRHVRRPIRSVTFLETAKRVLNPLK